MTAQGNLQQHHVILDIPANITEYEKNKTEKAIRDRLFAE
jgi:hypothetical protein